MGEVVAAGAGLVVSVGLVASSVGLGSGAGVGVVAAGGVDGAPTGAVVAVGALNLLMVSLLGVSTARVMRSSRVRISILGAAEGDCVAATGSG